MSDHRKQPKPNRRDKHKDERRKNAQNRTLIPSAQLSRSTTPGPSNRHGPAPGATTTLSPNPQSAPRRVDKGGDSLKGGDGAATDNSDAVHLPVGQPYGSSTIINVHGGVGGLGGQGGERGGHGGTGEGPTIPVHNSNVYVTNPHATQLQSIKEKLTGHVAAQHKSTDQSKSLCAAGTREEIIADIKQWLLLGSSTKERIFWITGIAGSGKSTLSATVVDTLGRQGTPIAAQFFISRNIPGTTNPDKIIPSIAQQLAESFPAAARIIHDTLKNWIPTSRKDQVEALLLAPIREISKSHNVVILIDALDEFKNAVDSVKEILESIAPKDCDLPDNVRFLVTSRPEHWAVISSWVNTSRDKTLELSVFKQHDLKTDSSTAEVNKFIAARMEQITPRDWKPWPPGGELQKFYNKADGLFHYAATALQWINLQIDEHGRSCQGWVFKNLTQEGGLDQLEDLYRVILTSFEDLGQPARNPGRRAGRLASFQHVIGTILVLYKPLTISQIIVLLADIQVDDLDVPRFLQKQFCSVLIPGKTKSFEDAKPQIHKSFRDYIMDGHAPPEFCILTGHAHFVTARSCLEVIVKAGSQSNAAVKYSVGYWYKHLQKAVEGGMTCKDERMWNLFGKIVEEAVVSTWAATDLVDLFVDVATAGWGLLKENTNTERVQGISRILMKAKAEGGRELEWELRTELTGWLLRGWGGLTGRWRRRRRIPYLKIWDEGLLAAWETHQLQPPSQTG